MEEKEEGKDNLRGQLSACCMLVCCCTLIGGCTMLAYALHVYNANDVTWTKTNCTIIEAVPNSGGMWEATTTFGQLGASCYGCSSCSIHKGYYHGLATYVPLALVVNVRLLADNSIQKANRCSVRGSGLSNHGSDPVTNREAALTEQESLQNLVNQTVVCWYTSTSGSKSPAPPLYSSLYSSLIPRCTPILCYIPPYPTDNWLNLRRL